MIAELVYDVKWRIILDSCVRAVTVWDIITSMIKAWVFGIIIAVVGATATCGHFYRSLVALCASLSHLTI
jgi:ABC-type transporter Mla maintaining outer membrane lipid asymmetry permease subunit MlaE